MSRFICKSQISECDAIPHELSLQILLFTGAAGAKTGEGCPSSQCGTVREPTCRRKCNAAQVMCLMDLTPALCSLYPGSHRGSSHSGHEPHSHGICPAHAHPPDPLAFVICLLVTCRAYLRFCRVVEPPPSSSPRAQTGSQRSARQLLGASLLQKTCMQLLVAAENPPGASCRRNRPHSNGGRSKSARVLCTLLVQLQQALGKPLPV